MLIGVVGKPNVGKSTFFKALTLADVEIANYPFATIKPNEGVAFVRVDCVDKELNTQCNPRVGKCVNGKRFVPVQVIDVAGLVPGAHIGRGLGNQFLDDLRQADVLIHVIDLSGSTNEKGESVDIGSYNPVNDVKFLEAELDLWYLGILKKGWEKFARVVMQEKQEIHVALAKQLSGLKVTEELVEKAIEKLGFDKEKPTMWAEEDLAKLAKNLRRQTKPMIIACNKADIHGAKNKISELKQKFPEYIFILCSAESELALREADKAGFINYLSGDSTFEILNKEKLSDRQNQALKFIQDNVLDNLGSTGVQDVIDKAVFELLKYIAIFPGGINKLGDKDGNILPDCFLLESNSTVLDFAYKIHTDLGKNFIRAIDVKSKRTVGKEHILKNRDVIEIISGK